MKWSIEELMRHTRLNQDNLQDIIKLATLEPNSSLKAQDLTKIQHMLVSVITDIDFHEKLMHWDKHLQQEPTGVNHKTIHQLHQLAYGTRHIGQIKSILESIIANNQPEKINKLNLKQYAVLYDLAELKPLVDEFQKKGLITGCKRLEQLHQYVTYAESLIKQLDPQFQQVFTPPQTPLLVTGEAQKVMIVNKLLSQVNSTLSLNIDSTKNISAQYRANINTLRPDSDSVEDDSATKKP